MKTLYLIGGTMGVGKTTTCQCLKRILPNSVFLDGDWCWDAYPFQVTDETIAMVNDNICHLLNNFLACSAYENVIFCWVMNQQKIIDGILGQLNTNECEVKQISLVCSEEALLQRLQGDIDAGIRTADVIERSLPRLAHYESLRTVRLCTTELTPQETARRISAL